MSEIEMRREALSPSLSSPGTPEPPADITAYESQCCSRECDSTPANQGKGKKRHRRAKGKKKKQKTCLMITNEDGTNSTAASAKQQKKVYLRPSNNPLLRAPKNSTQFIIDDHENSNLFWNFDSHPDDESMRDGTEGGDIGEGEDGHDIAEGHKDGVPRHHGMAVMPGQYFGLADTDRFSPDDDNFWAAYSERDFESVYETAHQEEIYSWERSKIIDEISVLEIRQKQLIDMLSQIDPLIYLQKLQHELLELQEQNRQLKLINIAEKLDRQARGDGSTASSPRMPDSTTERDGEESKETIEGSDSDESEEDSVQGGCSSGCCLAANCSDSCDEDNDRSKDFVNLHEHLADEETFENIEAVVEDDCDYVARSENSKNLNDIAEKRLENESNFDRPEDNQVSSQGNEAKDSSITTAKQND